MLVYTDDSAVVLIGVSVFSISRFPQGYAQNAPGTGAHTGAIREGRFSTVRGHLFTPDDRLRARLIEALMCDFRIDAAEMCDTFKISGNELHKLLKRTADAFPNMLELSSDGLFIPQEVRPLTRLIARSFDAYELSKAGHSSAI